MGINVVTLGEKLRGLQVLIDDKKVLDDALKSIKKKIETQEKGIVSSMCDLAEREDLDDPSKFSVVLDGRRYGLSIKSYYSIPAEKRDEVFGMLRDLGQGDLIKESVDDRALTNTLASITEANGGELPDEYKALPLSVYDKTKITNTKV